MPEDDNSREQADREQDRQVSSKDAGGRESRERVKDGGEPSTDALGNADGAS